jgi:cytochrome c-type biogenesis protein CcmH
VTALYGVLALLTLAVLAALLLPLLRKGGRVAGRAEFDRAVYRQQLRELDRDVDRGLIAKNEAKAAGLEIQRRLLATDSLTTPAEAAEAAKAGRSGRSPGLALALGVLVAAGAGGLYAKLGSPSLPDLPFVGRAEAAPAAASAAAQHGDMKDDAARLAQKLKDKPDDAEGWLLYARTVSMLGDWAKATDAYQHVLALSLKGAEVYSGYGEMLVMAADGIVSPTARSAFMSALAAEPKNEVSRYYISLADAQAGEVELAISGWLALAADVPENSPIHEEIARRIPEAAQSRGIKAPPLPKGLPAQAEPEADASGAPAGHAASAAPGPTPEQMAAAQDMPPEQREQMVAGMITKLAAHMQEKPDDLDGWVRLGRAYAVQGDTDKAMDAYDHAAKLKPEDPDIRLQAVSVLLSRLKPTDPLPQRAVAMLQDVAKQMPDAPQVLWYLGIVAARDGRMDVARENWTRLLGLLTAGSEDYKLVQSALADLKKP